MNKELIKAAVLIPLFLSVVGAGCGAVGDEQKSSFRPYKSEVTGEKVTDCSRLEPENPYSEGSGHYAGYEWAQENGTDCNGNSESFNEGCEEYARQEADYDSCLSKN